MGLRNAALAAILVASGASPALADAPAATLEMKAEGDVQIAPDGHVTDYVLKSKLPPAVADLVDRDVRGWRFEPVTLDGQPAAGMTSMRIKLKAEPAPGKDQYRFQIAEVGFGQPQRNPNTKMTPPKYPPSAVRAHLGARVLLCIRMDETGKVIDIHPYQTSLDASIRSEIEAESWRKVFESASMVAAQNWIYDPGEKINGKPVRATAIVPVEFSLCDARCARGPDAAGVWKAFVPGPIHPAPWADAGSVAVNHDLSRLPDGEATSLDSRFHLRDNVIGKTL